MTRRLPDFPWDLLAERSSRAHAHPDGVVDLSIGTPVDPVPNLISAALAAVSDQPGYPMTHGTPRLRQAVVDALARRHHIIGLDPTAVLPTIGSKELVSWLPTLLGVRDGELVAIPELGYPTYEVGARLAGAEVVRTDDPIDLGPRRPRLLWVNSPSNPTGRVSSVAELREIVTWARARDIVVASDECYLTLHWGGDPTVEPVSVLDSRVNGGSLDGLLAVHSLSKSSNLAGYRAGFVTGDPVLVDGLLRTRKHAGMMVPRPVQEAMTAALGDDQHVAEQRARYGRRREVLRAALTGAGFRIDHSEAGLYLWASRGQDAWSTVDWFAERGILVAPGTFYGP
ncbi:MAG: succinyldiaminopimelate transaminase, partial [Kutzneria sp.]|nr:succinyldiaminopimelate transaminase [Kutzneria sp.]